MAANLKLRALRAGHGMNQKDMCALLGLKAESSYSQKENGKRPFSQSEIKIISQRFGLNGDQVMSVFFEYPLHTDSKNDSQFNHYKDDSSISTSNPIVEEPAS